MVPDGDLRAWPGRGRFRVYVRDGRLGGPTSTRKRLPGEALGAGGQVVSWTVLTVLGMIVTIGFGPSGRRGRKGPTTSLRALVPVRRDRGAALRQTRRRWCEQRDRRGGAPASASDRGATGGRDARLSRTDRVPLAGWRATSARLVVDGRGRLRHVGDHVRVQAAHTKYSSTTHETFDRPSPCAPSGRGRGEVGGGKCGV